jgi:hypothetical protein
MTKHIELVGLLYLLAGAITVLVAATVFILGLGALSIASGEARVAAGVTAATFSIVALLLVMWAAVNAWLGRELRRGTRPLTRTIAFVVAVLHLFVLPFGTALGVYTMWVLLHPETRARFEGTA